MFYKFVWYIGSCIHINILCTFSICWAKITSCTISKLKYPFSDAWWKTWAPEGKKSRRIHSVAYSMPRGFAWVRASILMCRSGFFNILIFLAKINYIFANKSIRDARQFYAMISHKKRTRAINHCVYVLSSQSWTKVNLMNEW